jgi:hypothetical protein
MSAEAWRLDMHVRGDTSSLIDDACLTADMAFDRSDAQRYTDRSIDQLL